MHEDWVKRRGKFIRRVLNTLQVEERELASKGIIIGFENARNELHKLLYEVGEIQPDAFTERKPPVAKPAPASGIVKKSGYVIRKPRSS
jgi:hypothetical protein